MSRVGQILVPSGDFAGRGAIALVVASERASAVDGSCLHDVVFLGRVADPNLGFGDGRGEIRETAIGPTSFWEVLS